MLDLTKKTDQLKLLISAGYNRIMAERFLQPSNIDVSYSCVIWKEKDFDFLVTIRGVSIEEIKAGRVPGFEYVQYEPGEIYILEVSY